jgi:adenylate kinase family enzyme
MSKIIVHISGASGSGKTFLGDKLKKVLKNKVIVKDSDELRNEFIHTFYGDKSWLYIDEKAYQNYINAFIKNQKKSIIFVGLNDNTVFGKDKELYYNVKSKYNYYIDVDDATILKQKCKRVFKNIQKDSVAMNHLVNDNKKFIKVFTEAIKHECDMEETTRLNQKWKADYMKKNYKLASKLDIYKEVIKLFE